MAWSRATLVHAVTTATGTNNYTLQDPAGAGPYRTDVQANADGSLANGATVHYEVWDITVTGDASFERGWGIYTLATRTIARTAANVLDGSSGPGVLVSWGLSGQRDVIILEALDGSEIPDAAAFATNLGLPRLAADNNFTGQQTIGRGGGTQLSMLSLAHTDAGSTANYSILRHFLKDSTGANTEAVRYAARLSDITDGSEDGELYIYTMVAGALVVAARFSGGSIFNASNDKFVTFPTGGTVKMLFSSAPPAGWTRVNETNQAVIRLATAADTPNASGGSDSLFDGGWVTLGHTLIESQIPSHRHEIANIVGGTGGTQDGVFGEGSSATSPSGQFTLFTGGGGAHSHSMTTPYYRIACWATFD